MATPQLKDLTFGTYTISGFQSDEYAPIIFNFEYGTEIHSCGSEYHDGYEYHPAGREGLPADQ